MGSGFGFSERSGSFPAPDVVYEGRGGKDGCVEEDAMGWLVLSVSVSVSVSVYVVVDASVGGRRMQSQDMSRKQTQHQLVSRDRVVHYSRWLVAGGRNQRDAMRDGWHVVKNHEWMLT